MTVTFDAGTCGLIGPERRRQDDVLQRAERLRQARRAAAVHAFGEDLLAMPHYRRARWGLRRTFQTEQAIEELSVADNVALVARALEPRQPARRGARMCSDALEFVGLGAWIRT